MPEDSESGMEKVLGKRFGPFNTWEYIAIGSVGLFVFVKIKGRTNVSAPLPVSAPAADSGSGGYSGGSGTYIQPIPVPAVNGTPAPVNTPVANDPSQAPAPLPIPSLTFPYNSYYGNNGAVEAAAAGRDISTTAGFMQFIQAQNTPQPTAAAPVIPLGPAPNPQPTLIPILGNPANGYMADPLLVGSAQGAIATAVASGLATPAPAPVTIYNPYWGAPGGSNAYIIPVGGAIPIGVGNQTTVNDMISQNTFNQNYQYQSAAASSAVGSPDWIAAQQRLRITQGQTTEFGGFQN